MYKRQHYECTISSRNDIPAHSDAMGIALSSMCAEPIVRWGKKAMEDCEAHRVTMELTEIILAIIVSTGFVSNFVQVDYTTGMAHAMYNGFTILPSTEANHHLHGEVVSYGILVLSLIHIWTPRTGRSCGGTSASTPAPPPPSLSLWTRTNR